MMSDDRAKDGEIFFSSSASSSLLVFFGSFVESVLEYLVRWLRTNDCYPPGAMACGIKVQLRTLSGP